MRLGRVRKMTNSPKISHSIESEQSILGALLIDNNALDRIANNFDVSHFYSFEHRIIYNEICKQIIAGKRADVITIGERIAEQMQDAMPYLLKMEHNTPSSAGIVRYASIVKDMAIKRALMAICDEGMEIAQRHDESSVLVDLVASKIELLSRNRIEKEPVRLADMLVNYAELIEDRLEGKIKPICTGYKDLDLKLGGGLDRGTLTIIAGRPASGKTAIGLGIARNVSFWGSALFLSMEMSESQVIDRNVSALGKIPIQFLRDPSKFTGTALEALHWAGMTSAFQKAQNLNLFIDDSTSLNMLQIRAKARKIKRLHGLDVIVIDQLSFITGAQSDKSWESMGEYTRACIQLAKELDVPVVLLCQLNRDCEKRTDKRPMMADLAVSGSIEQDAAIILMLYRDEVYNPDSMQKGIAEVIIAKQRQGAPGTVGLAYIGEQTRFEDLSHEWRQPEPEQRKTRNNIASHL